MEKKHVAKASTTINAPADKVWDALTNPATIKQYFFGTNVKTDWKVGSPITWSGEWQGKTYEDKGKILEVTNGKRIRYTHFSPQSGAVDKPENYHTVTIDMSATGPETEVTLTQDNNETEEVKEHTQKNWEMVLGGLKKLLESQ